ncbi:hypothetical protein EDB92DRAFT_1859242 [Lactarius akahatsu]|uniref:25S rRNA (uridine-N(3))-methyltransferase BMT5-like domain-containing protein n=1 Tax=Lactarius akahatsu TaxID=416441 RepID=A0AAD4LJU1_9AGAM|nr:hypothetical protein EDB92DRAFT_1859242 [Lactarius akahatsu]
MVKIKKTSLKEALSSTQARLKKKKKDAAVHASIQKAKGVATNAKPLRRSTIPFNSSDKILLIGEGDFSFAVALSQHPPPPLEYLVPANITATAYDTEDECYSKYSEAQQYVRVLRESGAQVLFGVDATKLEKTSALKGKTFDRIVWNFPHAGKGITDQDRNILSNQVLILGFLRSAAKFLVSGPVPQSQPSRKRKRSSDDDDDDDSGQTAETAGHARGTILITLRNVSPYTEWDVPKLAKSPPPPRSSIDPPNPRYILLRSFVFNRSDWKGYEHRMTKGERAHGQGKTGLGGEDRTWEFTLAE